MWLKLKILILDYFPHHIKQQNNLQHLIKLNWSHFHYISCSNLPLQCQYSPTCHIQIVYSSLVSLLFLQASTFLVCSFSPWCCELVTESPWQPNCQIAWLRLWCWGQRNDDMSNQEYKPCHIIRAEQMRSK